MIDYKTFDLTYGSFGAEMIHEIINIYLEEYESKINSIEKSVETGDFETLGKVAHSLKGSTSVFYEDIITNLARNLELAGKNHDDIAAKDNLTQLKQEAERFAGDLKDLKSRY